MLLITAWTMVVAVMWSTVCGTDVTLDERWVEFKEGYNRMYTGEAEAARRAIWERKVKDIERHNKEADQGLQTYWMQETQWDDMTYEEYVAYHHGEDIDVNTMHRAKRANRNGTGDCFKDEVWTASLNPYTFNTSDGLPENVDWSEKGYVTSVKNQGRCGSCWAFGAVGALEGQQYKKNKTSVDLSPQDLVDCSSAQGNKGCDGGLPTKAYEYVILGGIATEITYPYTEVVGTCKSRASVKIGLNITGYKTLTQGSDAMLKNALAYIGPISVGIQTGPHLQSYKQGVFSGCSGVVNHAVLVVGYTTYNKIPVWKVKNSYGPGWGESGYFYLPRNETNACQISNYASYPTLTDVARGPVHEGEVAATIDGAVAVVSTTAMFMTLFLPTFLL
ncbi:cathepsin L-like proteinase [Haliotis cracherodii]|uniref:cathepsin L-like proteinase n=1 Tax=Haliotis cracherodii TaxID=6455 RepID=UPI0039E97FDB